jgi:antitoxin HicB
LYNDEKGSKELRHLTYKILLRPEPEGGFTVLIPSLPGCITFGETVEECIRMAQEAVSLYIEDLQERGEAVPEEPNMFEYNLKVTL